MTVPTSLIVLLVSATALAENQTQLQPLPPITEPVIVTTPAPTTVRVPREPRERPQPAPSWQRPEYASPNNGVTQFSQARPPTPTVSRPSSDSSSSNETVKKAEDHAKKAGVAANRMSMNPMDLFLRMQFQNAMNELNRTMKQLASEVKKGNVASTDVRQIQTKLANVFEQHAENPKAGEFLREHAKEGFSVLGAVATERSRGVRQDVRVNVSSSAATSSASAAASSAGEVVDLDRKAEVQSLPSSIEDPAKDPSSSTSPSVLADSTGALKQMDTLLVPSSAPTLIPREAGTTAENNAKEPLTASMLAARSRGVRLADASVGEGTTEEKARSGEKGESEEEAKLHEEELVSSPFAEFSQDEAQDDRPVREPASMGLPGRKLPFKLRRADGRPVSSFSELTWEDLAYFGGRLALLTVITCVSLCLLAFYLGSTLAARRRANEPTAEVRPYDSDVPPPPYG